IDYSKWDSIDTDSEAEDPSDDEPPELVSIQAVTGKQSVKQEAQKAAKRPHMVRHHHPPHPPIFKLDVPPIPAVINIPLVFYRIGSKSSNRADLDNQMVTYMKIDAISGFAPPEWQSGVGSVICARKERKLLLPYHVEGVWMFCDRILDYFGDSKGPPSQLYKREVFETLWKSYCKNHDAFRRKQGW
ncbi:hypothetical protein EJ06DRAFT_563720, partial [Trichodelitschia bisporula]